MLRSAAVGNQRSDAVANGKPHSKDSEQHRHDFHAVNHRALAGNDLRNPPTTLTINLDREPPRNVSGSRGSTESLLLVENCRMVFAGAEISFRTNLTGNWGRANAAPFDFRKNVKRSVDPFA
jgi:hypothetical protein